MSLQLWAISAILGLVEGLTEFIPVSSTGHLILTDHVLGFSNKVGGTDRAELFEVVIQLGAILAIGFLYRTRLLKVISSRHLTSGPGLLRTHILVAFLPAAILGFLFHKQITSYLFSPTVVAISLIVGGIIIIAIEKVLAGKDRSITIGSMTMRDALVVGFAQVLSLIPGVSRSGATIMGGYANGMTREAATEFSFLLSFPVMIAASGYELIKYRDLLTTEMLTTLSLGFLVAFISALVVVKWLIKFVRSHSFVGFGVYRIIFGILVLVLLGI